MRAFRVTPLNLVLAGLLTWIVWDIWGGEVMLRDTGWYLLLALVLLVTDMFFRVLLRNIRKIWLVQCAFLLLVAIIIFIITTL